MIKISVITPSTRPQGLELVELSMRNQDFPISEVEWITCTPFIYQTGINRRIRDRGKAPGDVWGHDKACNDLCKAAQGEVIVTLWDLEWIPSDMLSKLWKRYQETKGCIFVGGRSFKEYDLFRDGFNFQSTINFRGEDWHDPRLDRPKLFGECEVSDADTCLSLFPKQAFIDVGGFDEEFDKYGGLGDQEFFLRVKEAGYKLYLDNTVEYKQVRHPQTLPEGQFYIAQRYYKECEEQVKAGNRLKLGYAK